MKSRRLASSQLGDVELPYLYFPVWKINTGKASLLE